MFQEFPKMLVQGDEQRTVEDAEQEAAARAEGWHTYGEDAGQAEAKRKPGRPPKADKAD